MLTLVSAAMLAAVAPATPVATEPVLTAPQAQALRCSVAFALGARLQSLRDPAAANWPPLDPRGKEYFVRVVAQLMDDTGADRGAIAAIAMRETAVLREPAALALAIPACLPLLDVAGL